MANNHNVCYRVVKKKNRINAEEIEGQAGGSEKDSSSDRVRPASRENVDLK